MVKIVITIKTINIVEIVKEAKTLIIVETIILVNIVNGAKTIITKRQAKTAKTI